MSGALGLVTALVKPSLTNNDGALGLVTSLVLNGSTNQDGALGMVSILVKPSVLHKDAALGIVSSLVYPSAQPGAALGLVTDYGISGPNPGKVWVWDGTQWVRRAWYVRSGSGWTTAL